MLRKYVKLTTMTKILNFYICRKTWVVFPPKDTEYLKPTRVPYEESSVYSQLNLASPKQISNNKEGLC